jgi:hypothetical protein
LLRAAFLWGVGSIKAWGKPCRSSAAQSQQLAKTPLTAAGLKKAAACLSDGAEGESAPFDKLVATMMRWLVAYL